MVLIDFEKRVQQTPLKIAVEEAGMKITYEDLDFNSRKLTAVLKQLGVRKEVLVGVVLPTGINLVTSILAIFRAGAIYLPVDINFSPKRMEDIFEQSPPEVIISNAGLGAEVKSLVKNIGEGTKYIILTGTEKPLVLINTAAGFKPVDLLDEFYPDAEVSPDDANYIFYTSGSTGKPKPILGCHKSLSHFIDWEISEFKLDEQVRVSQLTQFTFDASLRDIFVPLCAGGTLCIPPADAKSNLSKLIHWIGDSELTLIHSVPSLFRLIIKELQQSGTKADFKKLRFFMLAGEPLFAKDMINWRTHTGENTELVNLYGPSETTMIKTFHRIKEIPFSSAESLHAGKPIANTFIAILNSNHQICNAGEQGEIYIRTPFMTKGYYQQPELTSQVFVQNPLVKDAEDIIYKTGDLGRYLKDRSIEVLGRIDDQLKINGIRIEPAEVRKAIAGIAGIDEVYVTGFTNSDQQQELVCYYTGQDRDDATLRNELLLQLNENMLPSYFIRLEVFPLNSNGKVDKKALPKPEGFYVKDADYEMVITATEKELEKIWMDVLGVKKIGRKVSFFNLGGTSLKATQVITRVFKIFKASLSIRTIFNYQSIAELADFIDHSLKENDIQIKKIPEKEFYAVSHGQKRLWVLTQMESDVAVYNMSNVFILTGSLNISALQAAFSQIVERHEILRTTFEIVRDELQQYVHSPDQFNLALPAIDLRKEEIPERRATEIATEIALSCFDFEQGPLLKASILQVAEHRYVFPLTMHHIISDGWSMEVLIKELLLVYEGIVSNTIIRLPELKIQYKDYAAWQNEQLSGENLQQHKQYWRHKLAGSLPVLELPYESARPSIKTFNGDYVSWTFEQPLLEKFKAICQENTASLHMGLLSVVYTLFYRYSGQTDLILGSPSAGRIHQDLESQIGFYVNLLPLRTTFTANDSFTTLLANVKETTLGAYEYQSYPFDKLVEDLQVAREMSRSPLFDVAVILHNTSINETQLGNFADLNFDRLESQVTFSKYDMQLNFYEDAACLKLNLEYNTDLFSKERMERMMLHLNQLMKAVVADAATCISAAEILSPQERHALVYNWNNTVVPYSKEKTLHQLFEEKVLQNPSWIAVEQNSERWTYQELNEQANQLARHLLDQGLTHGSNVAIMTDRNISMLSGMLGILKAGAAYVPIDPVYPIDRQLYICENSAISFIVTDQHYPVMDQLPKHIIPVIIGTAVLQTYPPDNLAIDKLSADLAYTIYTSGSTGKPKGVMIEHHSAVNLIEWVNTTFNVDQHDKLLFITSMCFDLSVYDIFGILAAGGTVVIATQEEVRDVVRLKNLIREKQITFWDSVPTSINHLISGLDDEDEEFVQHSLRIVFMSGDWIPVDLPGRIKKYFPSTKVISLGGATEGTVWSNYYPVLEVKEGWTSIPYGKPIDNNFFYILDEHLNPVPQGVPGELFIGGAGVARGYANDEEKTSSSYVNDPFHQGLGGKMYRTGDLGRMLADWNMEFLGRKDHQIKIRGFRVEIGEVNTTLTRNPAIKEAIIVAKGERNNKFLVAYFTSLQQLQAPELRTYLAAFLPDYMVPAHFIQLEKLPLNANGKIDHKAFPDPKDSIANGKTQLMPVTETEIRLSEIWIQILNLEQISVKDDFFSIGGHSLNATRILGKIHKEFGVRMEIRNVFLYPTIESMAMVIDQSVKKSLEDIKPAPFHEAYELSHGQQRLWLLDQSEPNLTAYHIPMAYVLEGELQINALEKAFINLIKRHESLRTRFINYKGQPRQVILNVNEFNFTVDFMDLSEVTNRTQEIQSLAEAEIDTPFDLENDWLIRVKIIRETDQKHLLLLTMHHIISDAWSIGILIKELTQFYKAYSQQEDLQAEPLPIQYKDFAYWQKKQFQQEKMKDHRNYWLKKFEGPIPDLQLPYDFVQGQAKTYAGQVYTFPVPAALSEGIECLTEKNGISPFITLTAVCKALLYRITGNEDLIIGTFISGRDHHLLEDQIGFYVNTLAIRTAFNGEHSFNQLLSRVKDTMLGAFEHQMYPFDLLVEQLNQERDTSSPLFKVTIEYQTLELREDGYVPLTGLSIMPLETKNVNSKFDLSFRFFKDKEQLTALIEYNTDLFMEESIQTMAQYFLAIAAQITKDPFLTIAAISLQEDQERLIQEIKIDEPFNFEF